MIKSATNSQSRMTGQFTRETMYQELLDAITKTTESLEALGLKVNTSDISEMEAIMLKFYDYGIAGQCDFDVRMVLPGTAWTSTYSFLVDTSKSFLIADMHEGTHADLGLCLHAAEAFFTRILLDGGERCIYTDSNQEPDGLTLKEVAIMANLDERTVRNATSGSSPGKLKTALNGSSIYIPLESARTWLSTKRGFVPTKHINGARDRYLVADFKSEVEIIETLYEDRPDTAYSINKIAALRSMDFQKLVREAEGYKLNNPELFALRVSVFFMKSQLQSMESSIRTATKKLGDI